MQIIRARKILQSRLPENPNLASVGGSTVPGLLPSLRLGLEAAALRLYVQSHSSASTGTNEGRVINERMQQIDRHGKRSQGSEVFQLLMLCCGCFCLKPEPRDSRLCHNTLDASEIH